MDATGHDEYSISSEALIPESIVKNLVTGKSIVTSDVAVRLEPLGIPLDKWSLYD